MVARPDLHVDPPNAEPGRVTPEQLSRLNSEKAHLSWAATPGRQARRERLAAAHSGLERRWRAEVLATAAVRGIELTEDEIAQAVGNLRAAHYKAMGRRSGIARRAKAAAARHATGEARHREDGR